MITAFVLAAVLGAAAPSAAVPSVASPAPSPAAATAVSFRAISVPDGGGPPIEVGVWSVGDLAAGQGRKLIVMSHGSGGHFRGQEDTARALAAAGYVVASLTHGGDNWRDSSRAADIAERPRQFTMVIDHMLKAWDGRPALDQDKVGAFGFSAGGFTVLTAAGGEPDMTRMSGHCRDHPDFFDCRLVSAHPPSALPKTWSHDSRIAAVVAAAPALGFTFDRARLAGVRQPVQLWRAEKDQILPSPLYAEPVRDALPRPPEYLVVDDAGHFDFLPPCSERLAAQAPMICAPTPGFDRAAFHERFNREVVRFFRANL
ncbi:alpha/beta hydrolase family protein [Caulobacter mirabilis]|uniref:Dienelactone hydrolase n=1 Tax=Caulobacter mirabilis TaxID=69666 RepID=A0A2D2B0P4_9CAUL|nr:prolyl oligopeptidase family serine peptidase [Caulobacter mirabilis]ATQ43831.1 dienelactone hydrolase [Caulobacter mirabilis]